MTNTIVQSLNHASEAWWPFALHATWTSCLVAAALLLLVRLGRRWPAKVRHAILLIALVKFALPPTLALPVGLFHWFGPEVVQNTSTAATTGAADAVSIAGWEDLNWKAWLFVVYCWGVIVAGGMIVRQMFRVRRIVRGATVVTTGPVYKRFVRLSRRMGIRGPIRLLASARPVAPMAFGLLRPSVLTPMSVHNRLPAGEVETVLAHELAHHRRGDLWLNWFQIVLRIVWWFNPVLRVLNRSIRQAGEDCCDDLLLARRVTSGEGYCQALLRVAKELGRQPMLSGALGFAESIHPLSQRMRRLMDPHLKRTDRIPLAAFAPMILLAALFLPGLPSRANPSSPQLATTESTSHGAAPQVEAARLEASNDLHSATEVPAGIAFMGSMFHPIQTLPTAWRYPSPDRTKMQYSGSDEIALADNRDDATDDNPAAAARSEEIFAVSEPLTSSPSVLGADTQLETGSRGSWSRWSLSESPPAGTSLARESKPLPDEPQPQPLEQQQRMEKQQYADGVDDEPKPIKMPSLPGGDENVPGIEKLQAPAPKPQSLEPLARRLPKQILQADDRVLAALTTSNRLTDARRLPSAEDSPYTDLADKLIEYLNDDPLLTSGPLAKNDDVSSSLIGEPIVLAKLPNLTTRPEEFIASATPSIKPETKIRPETKLLPSYLPERLYPPIPGAPCAVPEPLSLMSLSLGFTALLRRRKKA